MFLGWLLYHGEFAEEQNERIKKLEEAVRQLCPHKRLYIPKGYSCDWLMCEVCEKKFHVTLIPKGSKVKTEVYI
jgi:hypothetical protein